MDRVSGWYKRYAQKWLLGLALALAVACNVDTIHIIQTLSSDPKLLADTVTQAINTARAGTAEYVVTPHTEPAKAAQPSPGPTEDTTQNVSQLINNAYAAMNKLSNVSVPIGWSEPQRQYLYDPGHFVGALLGWFLTALAASLGAPFWFDTLQRFVNIRSNGRTHDVKDIGAKKDS